MLRIDSAKLGQWMGGGGAGKTINHLYFLLIYDCKKIDFFSNSLYRIV